METKMAKHMYFLDTREDMNEMSTCADKQNKYAQLNGLCYKLVKPSLYVGEVAIWEDQNGFLITCFQVAPLC